MKKLIIAVILIGWTGAACATLPRELPIVDAHGHLNWDMTAEELIALMDEARVSRMVLMARYYKGRLGGGSGSDQQSLVYARKYPGRFLPFVAGQRGELLKRERWLSPDTVAEKYLKETEEKLQSGKFYGIGEIIIRHYAYTIGAMDATGFFQGGEDHDLPLDSPLMRRLADLAVKYRVPLLIHAEGEPPVVADMNRLLAYNPDAKIIWAHSCGRCSAETIRQMLSQHPNLLCDLGGMLNAPWQGYGRYWPRRTPWMFIIEDGFGNLLPEMKALYEAFPDRFLLGTDYAHTPALRGYYKSMQRFRQLLTDLSPPAARRLAYENAEELFIKSREKNP